MPPERAGSSPDEIVPPPPERPAARTPTRLAQTASVLGVILAGGQSRRMGGGDKGLRALGGQPMIRYGIDRVAAQLAGGAADLALNANGDPARFAELGLPVVADSVPGFAGPLAGVLAGLDAAAARARAFVLTAAADTPFPPLDLAAALTEAQAETDADILFAATEDETGRLRRHPTFGLWRAALAEDLRHALTEAGERKVVAFADRYRSRVVRFAAPDPTTGLDPFFNVNTPEELAIAEAALQTAARSDLGSSA